MCVNNNFLQCLARHIGVSATSKKIEDFLQKSTISPSEAVSYILRTQISILYKPFKERSIAMKVSHATKYCLDYHAQNSKKKHNG